MVSPVRRFPTGSDEPSPPRSRLSDRRAYAFQLGEAKARRREISADAFLFLYKELVTLAGEHTYCWPSIDYLVESLDTSEGTVKRWLRELEHAALIQRRPRAGGRTTLTFITAFLTDSATPSVEKVDGDEASDNTPGTLMRTVDSEELVQKEASSRTNEATNMSTPESAHVFFVPTEEITADRHDRSNVIPPPIKTQIPNPGGGKGGSTARLGQEVRDEESETRRLLREEGIVSTEAIDDLASVPKNELEAIRHYIDQQRNVTCRAGLLVWLARRGMGKGLLKARRGRDARRAAQPHRVSAPVASQAPASDAVSCDEALSQIWQSVLASYRMPELSDDYATWLEPTILVDVVDDAAIVATPNVFVRDVVAERYRVSIEAALTHAFGRPLTVHLIIA